MKTDRRICLLVTIGLWGCGSSSSSSTIDASSDAPLASRDVAASDVIPAADLPAGTRFDVALVPDTLMPDTLTPDTWVASPSDGSASDGTLVTPTDTLSIPEIPPSTDLPQAIDAPPAMDSLVARQDSASIADGGSVVASTSTPDDSTEPTICSTVKLGDRDLSGDQTYDIVMPDCFRLSGTITLDSPLPDGAVFGNGSVNAFKIIRDASNRVTDTISYAATITAVDASHFRYTMGVPADTYEMMYDFAVKSSAQMPSVASRIGQESIRVSQSLKHDVTLPAIDVATYTVTVTGTQALASNGNAFGRFIEVIAVNGRNTLMVNGMSMTAGASIPIGMWVPKETITPFIMVQESPGATSPWVSGYVSQFKLDPITPTADFSLALPAAAKISGTISDPNQMLSPMLATGGAGTSAVSYYHCDTLDIGTFPDPIFMYMEGSTSSFFSASTSHAFYARKGLTCVTYANYAIATGTKGAMPTRAGENTYAFMQDPTPKSPDGITLTADITRNITVPDLGAQVTVTGTVKDARGIAIPSANLSFNSRSLTTAAVMDKTFVGSLDVGSAGTYTLHALPGIYAMSIALATGTVGSSTTLDAGVAKDAAPDSSFSLPDLGAGGDCTTLAACCPTLSGNNLTLCNTLVSTNVASACTTYLGLFKLAGSCQ